MLPARSYAFLSRGPVPKYDVIQKVIRAFFFSLSWKRIEEKWNLFVKFSGSLGRSTILFISKHHPLYGLHHRENSRLALETSFFTSTISFCSVIKNASVHNIVSVESFQIFVNVFQWLVLHQQKLSSHSFFATHITILFIYLYAIYLMMMSIVEPKIM